MTLPSPSGSLCGSLRSRFLPFFLAFIVSAFPNFLFIDVGPLLLPCPRIPQPPIHSPALFIPAYSFFQLFLFLLTLSPLVNDFWFRSRSLSLSLSALVRCLSSCCPGTVPGRSVWVPGTQPSQLWAQDSLERALGFSKWDMSGEGPGPLCVYHSMSLGGQ